jgi:predicted ATPase/transcriptional regulator with XRE-family HTH domain
MSDLGKHASSLTFNTFGDLLKYLRRRAQLTQRELAIAVGYSEAHLSRLEKNQRLPDLATLAALFIPALGLEEEPETVSQLLELAAISRGENLPSGGKFTVTQSVSEEVAETVETLEIPSNLPLQLTSFIGRGKEIEEIKHLLQGEERVRLLTHVGAGGCGKTRLALQVAEQLVPHYLHGVWFVDLTAVTDPKLLARNVASILGIAESKEQETIKSLITFLRPKKTLIIFDNCEQILTGAAQLIEALLQSCPQLQILATTREVLSIPGEYQFHVLPLPTPPTDITINKQEIKEFDSIQLFIERARNVRQDFDLTEENAGHVAQVCRRLDGIPLAIELAAARVGLLRVHQIESQLKDRFKLLTSGRRTLPRHQTLKAMIDWSHDLLSDEECMLFRRLSVFAGGWTLDAANAVAVDTEPNLSTLELLSRLVDKSFINVQRPPAEEARCNMLETLREYAFDKLETSQETTYIRKRHFEFFFELSQQAELYGNEKGNWLDRLEAEHENIRTALAWSFDYGKDLIEVEKVIKLVLSILDFYWIRGFTIEGREWMDKFLAIEMPASPLRALLLQKAGWFARGSGDFKKADMLLHRALEMAKEIGDTNRASWALGDLGLSARDQGDNEQSIKYFTEGLGFGQQSGEKRAIGTCLYNLAESYDLIRDLDTARGLWEQGLSIFREESDITHIAWGLEGLAAVAYLKKDFANALNFHLESLHHKVEVMDKLGMAYSFEGLAQVNAALGNAQRAASLWGAASLLRESMNIPLDPSREDIYVSLIPITREQIGNLAFEEAWKKGKNMKLEEAIDFALNRTSS